MSENSDFLVFVSKTGFWIFYTVHFCSLIVVEGTYIDSVKVHGLTSSVVAGSGAKLLWHAQDQLGQSAWGIQSPHNAQQHVPVSDGSLRSG